MKLGNRSWACAWLGAAAVAAAAGCGGSDDGADAAYASECGPIDDAAEQPNTLLSGINRPTTLRAACSPYHLEEPVTITAEVEIEPGVRVVACQGGCRSRITVAGGGRLLAMGSAEAPIVFTSEYEGDRGGQWTGILFLEAQPGSVLQNVIIEYAGGAYSVLQDDDEFGRYEFPVDGSLLNDSTRDLVFENVTIRRSDDYAIAATTKDGFEASGKDIYQRVAGITLLDNERGLWIPVDQARAVGADLCFTERAEDGSCPAGAPAPADNFIELHLDDRLGRMPENVTRDATWPAVPVPYLVDNINVTKDALLVVDDGVELRMTGLGGITVGLNEPGAIQIVGSAPGSIRIRAADDEPTPGEYWDGISLWTMADSARTRIENADIGYAGKRTWDLNQAPAIIQIFDASPTITGNHVHHSRGQGIHWSCSADPPGLEPDNTNTSDADTIACAQATESDGIAENFGCPCPGTGCQARCQP
jgi:hypothetical protein